MTFPIIDSKKETKVSEQLKGIAVFVCAVEAGSFALAATRLHLSRSAVGKTISRLEERLGVRLFARTTRSLTLTADGALFYEHCLRALAEIKAAETLLDSGKQSVSGRLRVSMPVLYGRMCVAPLLTEFASGYPDLTLELLFSDRIADLAEDRLDLVIRTGSLPDSDNLAARRLRVHRMIACASPSYLEQRGIPLTPEDLSQHKVINYTRSGTPNRWTIPDEHGVRQAFTPESHLLMDDLEAIAHATKAGFGIAMLPCWLVDNAIAQGELVKVLREDRENSYETHAVWAHSPHMALKVRLAIDMLVSKLPTSMSLTND